MDFYKLSIFFYTNFLLVCFFYSNIILKLDFGYNIFVFEVITQCLHWQGDKSSHHRCFSEGSTVLFISLRARGDRDFRNHVFLRKDWGHQLPQHIR